MADLLTCAFCGKEYPDGTPRTQHAELTKHVEVCEMHPMRRWKERAIRAEEALRHVNRISSGVPDK